jgi:hypothetical protein
VSNGSNGSNGHFRLAISMAYYLHDVRMLVIASFKYMLIHELKKQMSDGNSTCPLDPMDKQNSNGHFQVHWIQWIHWTLSFGHLNGLVSTWCLYACHYVIQYMVIDQMKKQMSDGNSTCPLDPMDKQNSNGHFQVHWIHWIHWTLSFGHLNGLVST